MFQNGVNHRHCGFTLIELLIVIGIIGTLASITIVAINPNKQLLAAKDVTRISMVKQLQNALSQYLIDSGSFPTGIPATNPKAICIAGMTTDATCVNLDVLVPKYLPSLPQDASETNANYTGYMVDTNAGRPEVRATYLFNRSGLVAYWRLDESSGTSIADSSGTGLNGTLVSGTHTAGRFGYGASYNGGSDYIDFGSPTALDSLTRITMSIWVQSPDVTQDQIIFFRGPANYLRVIGSRMYGSVAVNGTQYALTGNTTVANNTWYHVALTYDGAAAHLYLNGKEDVTPLVIAGNLTSVGSLTMGSALHPAFAFTGFLDDARIYNRALSASEIAAIAAGTN